MKILLIGHRGSGKTSLMKRLMRQAQKQGVGLLGIDLDDEIENRTNKAINSFFESGSESEFRDIEEKVLNEVINEWKMAPVPVVVSVGAGYMGALPDDWEVVWVRREIDKNGRVFLDRPPLNKDMAPIDDYLSRFEEREQHYKKVCDWSLTLQEGAEAGKAGEWRLFNPSNQLNRTVFTFLPHHVSSRPKLKKLINVLTRLGVNTVEYRDDLLTEEQIESLKFEAADFYSIMSYRKSKDAVKESNEFDYIDWPGEWGGPGVHSKIVSFHERKENETMEQLLKRITVFDDGKVMLKLAVPIYSLDELRLAHEWSESGNGRLFYPSSEDGRWQWYRMAYTQQKGLNFIRLDDGLVLDQPTPMEWINHKFPGNNFFAVFGNPVEHSRSPMEHLDFTTSMEMNFYKIRLNDEEFTEENLNWLQSIGLRGAAVTSPFKEKCFEICLDPDETIESLNTMIWDSKNNCWRGTNTDLIGLRDFLESLKDLEPVIWGGGGMLHPIKNLLPDCVGVSSRTGEIKFAPDKLNDKSLEELNPQTIIWAVGRSHHIDNWPPVSWQPRVIFDLNYTEDSPGREYALKVNSIYHSGIELFSSQAESQRNYWRNHVGKSDG